MISHINEDVSSSFKALRAKAHTKQDSLHLCRFFQAKELDQWPPFMGSLPVFVLESEKLMHIKPIALSYLAPSGNMAEFQTTCNL